MNRRSLPRRSAFTTAAVVCLVLVALCLVPRMSEGGASEDLAARVERIADQLPWLTTGDVIYDRDPRWGPDPEKVAALLRELKAPLPTAGARSTTAPAGGLVLRTGRGLVAGPDDVRPLLKHQDPKVRTLGIVLLLALERLDVMPEVAALVDDTDVTFPAPRMTSAVAGAPPEPWPMERKTVGDYARAAVEQYQRASVHLEDLWRSGHMPRDGAGLAGVFREMAATRDPVTNTATLRVAMERATGGISPMPGDRQERVQQVLMKVHNLPMPRRFFVALALDLQHRGGEWYAPTFLMDLARQVPRDVRLAALRGQRPVDDPDLTPGFGWDYFVNNAVHLLRESDVDVLLRRDAQQLDAAGAGAGSTCYASAAYAIAAARLAPARAEAILLAALEARIPPADTQFRMTTEPDAVAAALLELGGDAGARKALDWFFDQRPQPGSHGGGREAILDGLEQASPMRYRQFVARVIRDDRLAKLGPASTRMLIRAVQGYSGLPITDEEQIRDSYGVDEAQRDRHPAYLPGWHRQLRQTIDEWDPPR